MEPRDTSFDELIPELPHWDGGGGIDIGSWINMIGRHDHAIAYSRIFWPEFVVEEGCVFLAGFDPESFERVSEAVNGDKQSTEEWLNRTELLDLFLGHLNQGEVVTAGVLEYLGNTLAQTWEAKLRMEFPEVDPVVRFQAGNADELASYEITFFLNRSVA